MAALLASSVAVAEPPPAASPASAPSLADPLRDVPDFSAPSQPPVPEESLGFMLFRTVLVLGIVVAGAYVSLWALKRMMGIRGVAGAGASVVTLMERIPLDQKRALFVVKAAGEYLLIGGGEGSLSLLSKLDGAEVERLQEQKPSGAVALSPFLQKLLARKGGPTPPAA